MILAASVVLAQGLDLATFSVMPSWAEVNPLVQTMHTPVAWLAKALLVTAVLSLAYALPRLPADWSWTPAVCRAAAEVLAIVAIAAGMLGAGSNISVLVAA